MQLALRGPLRCRTCFFGEIGVKTTGPPRGAWRLRCVARQNDATHDATKNGGKSPTVVVESVLLATPYSSSVGSVSLGSSLGSSGLGSSEVGSIGGASGMGAYHGDEGFLALSHAKGVFVQSRWSSAGVLRAPFGRVADLALDLLLR